MEKLTLELFEEIKGLKVPILQPQSFFDFNISFLNFTTKNKPECDDIILTKYHINKVHWVIGRFVVLSVKSYFKRYIKYKTIETEVPFLLFFKRKKISYENDLEQIEKQLKNYDYEIHDKYISLIQETYFIVKNESEIVEILKKEYLEIQRKIHFSRLRIQNDILKSKLKKFK